MDASKNPHVHTQPLGIAERKFACAGGRASGKLALMAGALALCAAAIAFVGLDSPVSSALRHLDIPGDLAKAINLSEVFGHSLGAGAILGSVFLLAPLRRPAVWAAIAITLTSGVAANGVKSLFVRVRPHSVESIRVAQQAVSVTRAPGEVLALEDGLELVSVSVWDSRQRSFPSGHAATAWGLAIGLSLVFSRGIALFACFATLASLQRVTSGAHFPTDILAGAAIAFVVAAGLLMLSRLRKLLVPT